MAEEAKPNVLILGGCGFIGRNLVKFLVEKKLAAHIRVADKNLPAISYLADEHKRAFDEKSVQFVQADLTKDAHIAKAFKDDVKFDYVVNLCGETRFGSAEEEYKTKILGAAAKCAAAAVETKTVKKWIEVSTAQVYQPEKKAVTEEGKLEPWTGIAKYRLAAETALKAINGLPLVILRPAYVYGLGDQTSITPRAICAAVYQDRKEEMKFLWDKDLKLNTVHVDDLCAAIWHGCTVSKVGSTFNVADDSDSDQGAINGMLGELFKVKVTFVGGMLSSLAEKVSLSSVAEEANDKHVPGWQKICTQHKILNTPLSPYLDKEILKKNNLCISNAAIKKDGFTFGHPKLTKATLDAIYKAFIAQGVFPPVLEGSAGPAASS